MGLLHADTIQRKESVKYGGISWTFQARCQRWAFSFVVCTACNSLPLESLTVGSFPPSGFCPSSTSSERPPITILFTIPRPFPTESSPPSSYLLNFPPYVNVLLICLLSLFHFLNMNSCRIFCHFVQCSFLAGRRCSINLCWISEWLLYLSLPIDTGNSTKV